MQLGTKGGGNKGKKRTACHWGGWGGGEKKTGPDEKNIVQN